MKRFYLNELAREFEITETTLRYYDAKGIVPNMQRDENGCRFLLEQDKRWLETIKCLKRTNMSISDIRRYQALCEIGDSTLQERKDMIMKQKERCLNEIKEMQDRLEWLDYKEEFYNKQIAAYQKRKSQQ